jgi:hypothetical protein
LTDIIITNQLIYLVAHHFTGLTTTFLRRRSNETCQKLRIWPIARLCPFNNALAGEMPIPPSPPPPTKATAIDPDEAIPCAYDDPICEQSGETVETSDYLLVEALTALLSLY